MSESKISLLNEVNLSDYTTLGVGGRARFFLRLTNIKQLPELSALIKRKKIKWFILGGGSNVLFSDSDFDGLVIKNELKGISVVGNIWEVAAGENWDAWVERVVADGWLGVENLSGIPGTVGAAPVQNINAYGASVADSIDSVEVFSFKKNSFLKLSRVDCEFKYRDSIFKQPIGKDWLITKVFFKLNKNAVLNFNYTSASQGLRAYFKHNNITSPTAQDVRRGVLHLRSNIGMLPGQFNSAGSFFKNTIVNKKTFDRIIKLVETKFTDKHRQFSPWYWQLSDNQVKISTAFLLECTKFNKHTYGQYNWQLQVGLSPLHSLSIVTKKNAKAEAVIGFAEAIKAEVYSVFKVKIESEVIFVDKW